MANDTGLSTSHTRSTGLIDVLDRVLDKGLVIAGDVRISIAEVELLTIRIRLMVCSIDKAQEVGLDWWRYDRHLSRSTASDLEAENEELRRQIQRLERQLEGLPVAARRAPRLRPKPREGT